MQLMSRLIMSKLIIGKLSASINDSPSSTFGLGSTINLTKRLALVFFLVGLFAQAAHAVTVDKLTTKDTTPTITGTLATGETLNSVTVNGVATNTPVVDTSGTPITWLAEVDVLNVLNDGTYQVIATVTDTGGSVLTDTSTLTVDNIASIATFTYYIKLPDGSNNFLDTTLTAVKENDRVTIFANFDKDIAATPPMKITGTGVHTISATNMTRFDADTYIYTWTVGTGDGIQTFTLSNGTDLAGNEVTPTPTSGAVVKVDNTTPIIVLTIDSTSLLTNSQRPTITGRISELLADGIGIPSVERLSVTVGGTLTSGADFSRGDGLWRARVSAGTALLTDGTYEVVAIVIDAAGNTSSTATATLTVDSTAPVLVSYSFGDGRQYLPSETATNVATNANIVLTFDEAVMKVAGGGLTIRSSVSTATPTEEIILSADPRITVAGNTVTINPSINFAAGDSVELANIGTVVSDLAGNSAGGSIIAFLASATASTPTDQDTVFASAVSGMANAAITVVGSGNADDSIWFAPQSTQNFTESVTITRAAGNATSIYAPQASGTYRLFVQDRAGNVSSPSNAVLTVTADTTSPSLTTYAFGRDNTSYALTDSATEVPANVDIILNFSERVSAGTGTITLTPTGGTAIALDVTGAQVTANDTDAVTINPSNNLDLSTEYTVNIPAGAFVDRASRDATQATFSFSVSATPPTPDPATVKDVVSGVNMQADIAVDWTKTSVTTITNRMNWLRRHKGSNNLSHQGITLNFAHPTLDALFKAEYKANNPKENSLVSQARLANMARTLANNTKHNADHSTSVFAALKQELSDRAANEFAKLAHNTLDNTLGHLTALNPLSGNSISDTWAIWTAGNITLGDYDATTTTSAQDSFSQNISLGVDRYTANDKQLLGVAVSLGRGDVEIGNNDTTLNSDAISFAVYTALDLYKYTVFEGMTAIEGMIGVGGITVDTKRRGDDNILLTGSRDIRQIFASLTFRGKFQQKDINLSPYGRVNVSHSRLGDFAESGSDFALTYNKQDINNLVLYTGLDVDYLIELNQGALRPFGVVEYGADISPSSDAVLYYLSDPTRQIYTLSTDGSATHNLKFGIGVEYKAQTGAYGSVGYERTEIIDSGHTDSFDLELGLEF